MELIANSAGFFGNVSWPHRFGALAKVNLGPLLTLHKGSSKWEFARFRSGSIEFITKT